MSAAASTPKAPVEVKVHTTGNIMRSNINARTRQRAWMRTALAAAVLASGMTAQLASAQTLPPPAGLAVPYDDFWSYSTAVLDYRFPTAGWMDSAGTGVLDILITTRSSGQQNPSPIPDPITNSNDNPLADSWGAGSTAETTMLVKDLYKYLMDTFGANTPVFTFDQNETGGNPNLLVTAKVEVIDGGSTVALWALDNTTNGANGLDPLAADGGIYDLNSVVTAPGLICVEPNPGDTQGLTNGLKCFSNNVGSGRFDYLVYSPSMNLTAWKDDPDAIFKVSWTFADVDDGGEEITLTGRFTPGNICETDPTNPVCQTIPEPGTLALGGLALLGLWGASRRRRQ